MYMSNTLKDKELEMNSVVKDYLTADFFLRIIPSFRSVFIVFLA